MLLFGVLGLPKLEFASPARVFEITTVSGVVLVGAEACVWRALGRLVRVAALSPEHSSLPCQIGCPTLPPRRIRLTR